MQHEASLTRTACSSKRPGQQRLPASHFSELCCWKASLHSSAAAVPARRAPEHEVARLAKFTPRESEVLRLVVAVYNPSLI